MRLRRTARVLLLDPAQRILLMKGRLPTKPEGPAAWFTIGGGAEPGESLEAAARREVREETGATDFTLGPIVWTGEIAAFTRSGADLLVQESYFIAHSAAFDPSRAGWQALEREFIDDMRWWALADILASGELFYPLELARLLPDVIAGRTPGAPITLAPRRVAR
ncbi:MAG: NUDIX hydrolase [Hyphomonadaceae bacterium]